MATLSTLLTAATAGGVTTTVHTAGGRWTGHITDATGDTIVMTLTALGGGASTMHIPVAQICGLS